MRRLRLRPLNGWRAFWGEVGVIVLGVLIALGAQQAADRWDLTQDLKAARLALRQDYIEIVVNARERVIEDACLRRRLEQIATMLDAERGNLPDTGYIGSPPSRSWYPGSWDSVAGSRVAAIFPRDDFVQFGTVAQTARLADQLSTKEMDAWAQVYRVVGRARTVSADEIADIRTAVAQAAFALNLTRLVAPQLEKMVLQPKLLTAADLRTVQDRLKYIIAGPNYRATCGPIGPAPSAKVTAPYDPAIQVDPLIGVYPAEDRKR